jgi:hypothetical protein
LPVFFCLACGSFTSSCADHEQGAAGIALAAILLAGCTNAGIGGVVGAGAAAGGYELHLKRQLDRVEADLASGAISQQEFDIRKDQISRDSFVR